MGSLTQSRALLTLPWPWGWGLLHNPSPTAATAGLGAIAGVTDPPPQLQQGLSGIQPSHCSASESPCLLSWLR